MFVCISVRLSVRVEKLGSYLKEFHKIWYLSIFRKSVEKIQISIKYDKNNEHFTWRAIQFDYISNKSSCNWKYLRQKLQRTVKHAKTREIYWLIGKHSPLSLENKLLIYKAVLNPVWTYGLELWGCATKSNIAVIQRYQSKFLRTINNAPWYVSNHTLHSKLHVPHFRTVLQERTANHRTALDSHPNPLILRRTISAPAGQKALKTKMDIRWDILRKRRWTPPRPPPTATAH
jgi:hypothetical protein